ncbi:MAG: ankyrin repeat domain-containing protein [Micavibrio sp.]|nr:MAG: ankyrin repeat domain-containing protein [Micavibrio sp.]
MPHAWIAACLRPADPHLWDHRFCAVPASASYWKEDHSSIEKSICFLCFYRLHHNISYRSNPSVFQILDNSAPLCQYCDLDNMNPRPPGKQMPDSLTARLFHTIHTRDIDAFDAVLNAGADINGRDINHNTPVMEAVYSGNITALKKLIAAGADIHAENEFQNSALGVAAFRNNCYGAELLIESGADIEHENSYGETPLIYAARYGYTKMAQLLLQKGADPERITKTGKSALKIARENSFYGIADLIDKAILEKREKEDASARESFEEAAARQRKTQQLQNQKYLRAYRRGLKR